MNTNNQTQTDEQLEECEAQYWVEQWKSLKNLYENKDFQKVILEGYFKDRAIEGVSLLATDYIKKSGQRPDVMEGLVAISNLEDHFATIKNLGSIAEETAREAELPVG